MRLYCLCITTTDIERIWNVIHIQDSKLTLNLPERTFCAFSQFDEAILWDPTDFMLRRVTCNLWESKSHCIFFCPFFITFMLAIVCRQHCEGNVANTLLPPPRKAIYRTCITPDMGQSHMRAQRIGSCFLSCCKSDFTWEYCFSHVICNQMEVLNIQF